MELFDTAVASSGGATALRTSMSHGTWHGHLMLTNSPMAAAPSSVTVTVSAGMLNGAASAVTVHAPGISSLETKLHVCMLIFVLPMDEI